jgi:predicted GH43/DUF377 family glycosyl hydrolase
MFNWKRIGQVFNPLVDSREPWMTEFAQAPASLVFEEFLRIYFSTRPPRDQHGQYVSYSTFVDVKRSDPTQVIRVANAPILDLGRRGTFDEFGIYPVSVTRVENLIFMYYGGWTRCASTPYNVAIGLAVSSDDGVSFQRLGPGPILGFSLDEPMTVSGPKVRQFNGRFYLWYVAGERWLRDEAGRPESIFKIRMATSNDGVSWVKQGSNLVQEVLGKDECQASPDVFFFNGSYHMIFSYKHGTNFRGTSRGYRLGYARSSNLVDWDRDDSFVGLTPTGTDTWDGTSVAYPHFLDIDNRQYLFYLGNDVGREGFGVAELVNGHEIQWESK